jgi:hypothetical protein
MLKTTSRSGGAASGRHAPMAVVIHFKDGNTTLLRRAARIEETTPSTPQSSSQLTFVCYDADDRIIGRFDIHEIRGYYITDSPESEPV